MLLLKTYLTAALGLLFVSTTLAQRHEENYSEVFSGNYQQAIKFLQTEKAIDSIILSQGLNPKELVAIIFPELIRYNSIQDKIETFALETLYVQYGKKYANFSVGEFQIKPSFAEKLEIDFLKEFPEKKWLTQCQVKATDTVLNQENRMKRLKKIKSKKGMAHYLCLFWEVMSSKYPSWKSEEEKIRFFATAYNSSYWASRREIESFMAKKYFHAGLSMTSTKYNYADIAWYYFQQP